MSWYDRLWRRHDSSARIQQTRSRVISPGSFTTGAGGPFLRRDDEWLGRDAVIRVADSGCRSLEDHRLYQSVAVKPDAPKRKPDRKGGCSEVIQAGYTPPAELSRVRSSALI